MANNQQQALSNQQQALIDSLSPERFKPYLDEAKKHFSDPIEAQRKAIELYQWATELAGLFQVQISYLEVALRNAINKELRDWNNTHRRTPEWHDDTSRETSLDALIDNRNIGKAIKATKKDKGQSHSPTQPDIIAKLSFGFWVNLIKDEKTDRASFSWLPLHRRDSVIANNISRNRVRATLWTSCLHKAFPHQSDRQQITKQVSSIHQLRNRIAHHDNILKIHYIKRLNEIYGLLGSIGAEKLIASTYYAPLREHVKADPRLKWQQTVQEETPTPSYKETLWKKIARKLTQLIKLTK